MRMKAIMVSLAVLLVASVAVYLAPLGASPSQPEPETPVAAALEGEPAVCAEESFDPDGQQLCHVQFCKRAGVRCVNIQGDPCCKYQAQADPTCTGSEPHPPNFCGCIGS